MTPVLRLGCQYPDRHLVDIDIVQTTHLDTNVQSSRHNAFNLNRELVDDLRDVIVNKQRAYQRRSRLQVTFPGSFVGLRECEVPAHQPISSLRGAGNGCLQTERRWVERDGRPTRRRRVGEEGESMRDGRGQK